MSSRSKAGDPSSRTGAPRHRGPSPSPLPSRQRGPGGRGTSLHAGATTKALRSVEGTQDNARTTLPALWQQVSYLQSRLLEEHKLFLEEPRLRRAIWRKVAVGPCPQEQLAPRQHPVDFQGSDVQGKHRVSPLLPATSTSWRLGGALPPNSEPGKPSGFIPAHTLGQGCVSLGRCSASPPPTATTPLRSGEMS